jgi:hypothetical protein
MMRWLVCLAITASTLLFAASDAAARKLVVMDPPMVRACPRAKTFNLVMTCLAKHGTAKLVRDLRGAKLVRLEQASGRWVDATLILYVERRNEWQIGGLHRSYGANESQLLAFEPVTVGKRTGYRIELGSTSQFTYMVDGITPVPADLRTQRSLYCSGDNYRCADVMSLCDVTVGGRTWHTFRGTLSIAENMVVVKGDRSRAGPSCNASERVYLGWPQN